MAIALIEGVIWWLNAFPLSNGFSYTKITEITVPLKQNTETNQKRRTFVSYTMVYIGTNNNMKRRSVPAIALNESKEWGEYNSMSLCLDKTYTVTNGKNCQLMMT